MWKLVSKEVPDDDREVLVYVRNLETPHWSTNKLGAYIDGKWYLRGGRESYEEIVKWLDIPLKEEFKTVEDWNKIFNREGVELSIGGLLTERKYIMRTLKNLTLKQQVITSVMIYLLVLALTLT